MRYDDFENLLQEDLAWRKKEISELYLLVCDKKNEVLMKSIILVLYAHWEGYIKKSSKLYIRYISEKKVNVCDLTPNFKAIVLKTSISNAIDLKENLNLSKELEFMIKYHELQQKKFKVSINVDDEFDSKIINSHDNLNPKVFKNILNILGVKYIDSLSSREHYINSTLLGNRNAIGHGSKFDKDRQNDFDLSPEHIRKLKNFIIGVLDCYKSIFLDYIDEEFYLEKNHDKKCIYDEKKNNEFEVVLKEVDEDYNIVKIY